MREYISAIGFSFVLGSVINLRELLDLIYLVDEIDWSEVPLCQARRGTRRNDT